MGWLVGWLVVGQWIIGMVLMNNNMLIEIIERGQEKAGFSAAAGRCQF